MRIYVLWIPGRTGEAGPINAYVAEADARRSLEQELARELAAINKRRYLVNVSSDLDYDFPGPSRPVAIAGHGVAFLRKTIHYFDESEGRDRQISFSISEVEFTGSPLKALAMAAE